MSPRDNSIILKQEDKPSPRDNPRRGYHDSIRTVTFVPTASQELKRAVMNAQREELRKTSMWCWVKEESTDTWSINYGYDSGD